MRHRVLLILVALYCSCNRAPKQANIRGAALQIKENFESMAGIAIGYPGESDVLRRSLQDEEQPNAGRRAREFAFEGRHSPC